MSEEAKDANAILAVATVVKHDDNITFTDDNGLVVLFERGSFEELRKGKLCLLLSYS